MRKIIALLLSAIVLLSLAACGSAREQQSAIDEAYRNGYNEGYEDGYESGRDSGWEDGYYEAMDEYCVVLDEVQYQIGIVIDMIDEFDLYEISDISEKLNSIFLYIGKYLS